MNSSDNLKMLNIQIFQFINSLAGQNVLADRFFIFITLFGNLLLFLIILLTRNKKLILKSIIGYIAARAIDFGINLLYYKPRPFIAQKVALLITQAHTGSFPSGHAMTAFVFAQLFYFWNKKYSAPVYILAFLVALSRIYVGVHYPIDTLAGIVLGIGVAFIIEFLFKRYNLMKRLKKKWKLFKI